MDRTIPAGSYALKLTATDTWDDTIMEGTATWDGDRLRCRWR